MNQRPRTAALAVAAIAVVLPLSSCDDPEKVSERDRLEEELERKNEQLEQLNSRLLDPGMPDRSEELREAEAELDAIKNKIAEAENENARLRDKLDKQEQDARAWKEAHPLGGHNNN